MPRIRKYSRRSTEFEPKELIADMSLVNAFDHFMTFKRTEGLADRTLTDHERHFGYFLAYLDGDISVSDLSIDLIRTYIAWMLEEKALSPVTVNIRVRCLRTMLRFMYDEGFLKSPIHSKIRMLRTEEDTIQSFTSTEVQLLLRQVDTSTYVGFRDYTMICVLLDTMVRISELLALRRQNVRIREGEIRLEARDTKSRRSRTVPISSKTMKLLATYLKETSDFGEEILFLTYDGRPMSPYSWRDRLREYGDSAGIRNKRVSPHTFRHTGALFYIMNGGDPFSLQRILGHSDMSMVRKYIQMTNVDVKRQHNVYSPLKNLKL